MDQAAVGIQCRGFHNGSAGAAGLFAGEHPGHNAPGALGFHGNAHLQKAFPLAAVQGQNTVARDFGDRLGIIIILGVYAVFVLSFYAFDHAERMVVAAQLGAAVSVIADGFGNDILCPGQSGCCIGDFLVQVVVGGCLRVKVSILLQGSIGQRLQAASTGDAGAGLALGLIRTIDILHLGQCFGTSQSGLQFRRHGVLRFNGAGHFFFTLIQSAQVFQAVAQVAQHLVIHRAGSFFAVAGNKWDGVPGIDQVNGTLYVFQAQVQFLRQLFGMVRHLCSHFLFYEEFSTRDFPAFFEKKASAKKL